MKNNFTVAALLAGMLLAFAMVASAQITVGGYRSMPSDDPAAKAAADFAIKAQSEKTGAEIDLIEITKAERQVVQGTNFRLGLRISGDGDDETCATAVVYYNLKREYKLSSWVTAQCSDATASADGFTPISKNHGGAQLAADFAVKEQQKQMRMILTLDDIRKAEIKEVVGGNTDFRLCLDLGANGTRYAFKQAVVSMDQYSNLKIVSWTDSNCGGATAPASSAAGDGFKAIETDDSGAAFAANFAVREQAAKTKSNITLGSIVKGEDKETMNGQARTFRLCMKANSGGKLQTVQAVISMDAYSNFKLLSWTKSDCSGN